MSITRKIKDCTVRLEKGDITDFEVEAIVFYAREDLKLMSGFGNAISTRGGPTIQKALDEMGEKQIGEVVVTEAGNMKTSHIIHAVGPKFLEADMDEKLALTVRNTLAAAEEKGFKQLALPAMGAGFYGIARPMCAEVMLETISGHIKNGGALEEVIIRVIDTLEYEPFAEALNALN
jgi:O-acetyl-ADP-ribose deacetylase (regulator of RNase III)